MSSDRESFLTQLGLFFTKAAFVSFDGASARLSYVYQSVVEHSLLI